MKKAAAWRARLSRRRLLSAASAEGLSQRVVKMYLIADTQFLQSCYPRVSSQTAEKGLAGVKLVLSALLGVLFIYLW